MENINYFITMKQNFIIFLAFLTIFSLTGCNSTKNVPAEPDLTHFSDGSPLITSETAFSESNSILLTFAGDLMAHTNVTRPKHFDEIYADVKDIFSESDFTFANLETPVLETEEYSSYPNFNVKNEYVEEAIKAGINVFSLSNNHTNDMFLEGIKSTRIYFENKIDETKNSSRPVYAAGIKKTAGAPLTYQIIEKNDWKILFLAVTEIINRNDYLSYIDFVRPTESSRQDFFQTIKSLKEEIQPDLFILSFHCSEAEYVRTIPVKQKKFYNDIIENGVDVLWINHAHVPKEWELFADKDGTVRKAIFYGMGNTISGQRSAPNFTDLTDYWDYTGDGILCQLRFEKNENGIQIIQSNPVFITTYITPKYRFIIKKLNDKSIGEIENEGAKKWASYLRERKKLIEKIEGKLIWQ